MKRVSDFISNLKLNLNEFFKKKFSDYPLRMYVNQILNDRKKRNISFAIISFILIVPFSVFGLMGGFSLFDGGDDVGKVDRNMYSEPPEVDNSILRIIQSSPVGTLSGTDKKAEVVVVFNHPMVPLASLDSETKGAMDITPSVKGSFRWYGSRICSFIPESGWSYGQTYTVKVQKGAVSLNGKSLPDDYAFSFTMNIPELTVDVYPLPWRETTVDYNQSFVMNLNYPVKLAEIKEKVKVVSNGKSIPFKIGYEAEKKTGSSSGEEDYSDEEETSGENPDYEDIADEDKGRKLRKRLYLTPSVSFEHDASVNISIDGGLYSEDQDALMGSQRSFSYKTHGPLTVKLKNDSLYYQDFWENRLVFSNTIDLSAAKKAIKISPPVKWEDKSTGTRDDIPLTTWNMRPGKEYFIHVGKMKDIYGNVLQNEEDYTVRVPEFSPQFYFEENYKSVLESKAKTVVPVRMCNVPELSVKVGNFSLKEIAAHVGNAGYDYSIAANTSGNKIFTWKTGAGKYNGGRFAFDLSDYLSEDKTGWCGISVTGNVLDYKGNNVSKTETQVVQVTDLGISVKETFDSSSVWIHSLSDGSPVRNADVSFYNGEILIGKASTDKDGYCSISNSEKELLKKSIYVVSSGKHDSAYVTSRDNSFRQYYIYNQYDEEAYKKKILGQIIFDRKLYRPGDTVMFKAVMVKRENGKSSPLSGETMNVKVEDSEGKKLFDKSMRTSSQGGVWGSLLIPADSKLGHFQVRVSDSANPELYVNDTFQVEEFRPVSFSVGVFGFTDSSVEDNMKVTVEGRYLFGSPMSGGPVSYGCYRLKRRINIPNYADYTFGDGNLWDYGEIDWSNAGFFTGAKGTLGHDGKYTFTIVPKPMLKQEKINEPQETMSFSDIYDMKLETKVRDVDDKTITHTEIARVYPGKTLIGIRTKSRYQHMSKPFDFDLVALGNDGKPAGDKQVTVSIIKHEYKSIMSKGPGGTLQPRNIFVKRLVDRKDMSLSDSPKNYSIDLPEAGSYTIVVQENGGLSYSRESVYSWGGDKTYWSVSDDDTISIIPDKKEYKPGETARVLIQSPYQQCKAILTLERESVIWQKTIDINGSGTPVEIPMKEEYLPNVFFSVMIVRPRQAVPDGLDEDAKNEYIDNDLGIPKFKAGIVKLSVSNESKKAKLTIETDKNDYSPGEVVTVTLKTKPNAEIALSAADRAVLDLVDYRYANPINKFYQNWQNAVRILENRRFLIRQFKNTQKGESPGGQGKGDELEGAGGFSDESEDGSRSDIRYTAYWNPAIIADEKGEAVITFKLPHNLTTFRLMALSSANDTYGSGEKEIKVKKSLVIQKNLPRFIRPGDIVSMGAVVTNQTGMPGQFRFSIDSELLKGEETESLVSIDPGESKEITFPVSLDLSKYAELKKKIFEDKTISSGQIDVKGWLSVAPENLDNFTAKGMKKRDVSDRLEFSFPVKEQLPDEAFTIAGFTNTAEKEFIRIPDKTKILPYMGSLDVTLSPSALCGLNRGFAFYKSSPYFCLEQRASAYLLAITSGELLKTFSFSPPSASDYDFSNIERLFTDEISSFQNIDGGLSAWKNSSFRESDPYLTAYVVFVMEVAKQKGKKIPESEMNRAITYLKNYIKEPKKDGYTFVYETFSLVNYVFSIRNEENSSLTKLLLENEDKLSIRAKANLAVAIAVNENISDYNKNRHTKRIFESIKNSVEVTTRKVSFKEGGGGYRRAFYSTGATAASVMRMMMALDRNNTLIPSIARFIIADSSVWSDSHGSGMSALALHDFYELYEKKGSFFNSYDCGVTIDGKTLFSTELDRKKLEMKSFSLPIGKLFDYGVSGKDYPMVFSSSKENRMYYTATLNYTAVPETAAPRDEGIEVTKDYLEVFNPKKKVSMKELKRGEIYLCRVRIVVTKPSFNIVIDDPLPSCVEIVNTSFSTEESSLAAKTTAGKKNYDYWWERSVPVVEYRDDRVLITQDYLSQGIHDFTYLVRPVLKGTSAAPAAMSKLMYEPEIFGRSSSGSVIVQ